MQDDFISIPRATCECPCMRLTAVKCEVVEYGELSEATRKVYEPSEIEAYRML